VHIEKDQIPTYYGGELLCGDRGKDSARHSSPEELVLNERVRELNGEVVGIGASASTPLRGGAAGGGGGPLTPWSIGTTGLTESPPTTRR